MPTMVGICIYQIVSLFLAKFHYIEFWLTSYTRGGCPPKQFFLKTSAIESNTSTLWVLNLIYGTHAGRGVGLPDCCPFLEKFQMNFDD